MSNTTENLVEMANDIGAYFITDKDHERACNGVRNHIEKFWEPRMRRRLIEHWQRTGGKDLSPLVAEAVKELAGRMGAQG